MLGFSIDELKQLASKERIVNYSGDIPEEELFSELNQQGGFLDTVMKIKKLRDKQLKNLITKEEADRAVRMLRTKHILKNNAFYGNSILPKLFVFDSIGNVGEK